jgi:hypothetical protein
MRSLGWQQLEGVVLKLKLRRLSVQRRSVRRVLGQQVLNVTDAERWPHANGGRRRKAREETRAHEFEGFFFESARSGSLSNILFSRTALLLYSLIKCT